MSTLEDVYRAFVEFSSRVASSGPDVLMDGRTLVKLCTDCKLITRKLTRTDVDLIFAKVKDRTAKRINFQQFEKALREMAIKKGIDYERVVQKVEAAGGPSSSGTRAQSTRFFDDKDSWTGAARHGGPSTNDDRITLSKLSDRSLKSDVRGVIKTKPKKKSVSSPARSSASASRSRSRSPLASPAASRRAKARSPLSVGVQGTSSRRSASRSTSSSPSTPKRASAARRGSPSTPTPEPVKLSADDEDKLKNLFDSFCSFGGGRAGGGGNMDGRTFTKFCKETKLVSRKFTSTDADLIFTKTKGKTERKITYRQFHDKALPLIAIKKGVSTQQVVTKAVQSRGPNSTGTTRAEATRFHDDKSAYTGVYKHGGPSAVDSRVSLKSLSDRSRPGDIRGVQR